MASSNVQCRESILEGSTNTATHEAVTFNNQNFHPQPLNVERAGSEPADTAGPVSNQSESDGSEPVGVSEV